MDTRRTRRTHEDLRQFLTSQRFCHHSRSCCRTLKKSAGVTRWLRIYHEGPDLFPISPDVANILNSVSIASRNRDRVAPVLHKFYIFSYDNALSNVIVDEIFGSEMSKTIRLPEPQTNANYSADGVSLHEANIRYIEHPAESVFLESCQVHQKVSTSALSIHVCYIL